MAILKFKVRHQPDGINVGSRDETVSASYVTTEGGWVEFGDGDGIVLRLPEKTVQRVERVTE
jgi:hypothetical protein